MFVSTNLFNMLGCVRNIHLLFYLNKIKPESKSKLHPTRLLGNAFLAFIKASTVSSGLAVLLLPSHVCAHMRPLCMRPRLLELIRSHPLKGCHVPALTRTLNFLSLTSVPNLYLSLSPSFPSSKAISFPHVSCGTDKIII